MTAPFHSGRFAIANDLRNRRRLRGDNGEVYRLRNISDCRAGRCAKDARFLWVYEVDASFESAKIFGQSATDASRRIRCPNQCDRFRREDRFDSRAMVTGTLSFHRAGLLDTTFPTSSASNGTAEIASNMKQSRNGIREVLRKFASRALCWLQS